MQFLKCPACTKNFECQVPFLSHKSWIQKALLSPQGGNELQGCIRLLSEIFAIVPELFWWGVDGDDLITEAAELAPFEAETAEAVALVAIVSSFNLLLGHPENKKFLFQKSF